MPACKLKLKALSDEELELEDLGREQFTEPRDESVDRDEVVLRLER
jgi:hypothetical protein